MLASLRPYSEAWWAVRDAIEDDYNTQLARKLVICQGCLPHATPQEATGSVPVKP